MTKAPEGHLVGTLFVYPGGHVRVHVGSARYRVLDLRVIQNRPEDARDLDDLVVIFRLKHVDGKSTDEVCHIVIL